MRGKCPESGCPRRCTKIFDSTDSVESNSQKKLFPLQQSQGRSARMIRNNMFFSGYWGNILCQKMLKRQNTSGWRKSE